MFEIDATSSAILFISLISAHFLFYNIVIFLFLILFSESNLSTFSFLTMKRFLSKNVIRISAVISLFSVSGIPPFVGFFSKLAVLLIVLNASGAPLFLFIVPFLLLSLFFYLQNVRWLLAQTRISKLKVSRYLISNFLSTYTLVLLAIFVGGYEFFPNALTFFLWIFF